ncbi:hypothetical protein ASPWEDRAFT_55552 [Aspergillus wentii DTO 134E9]|uniref:BTB domain-containing protein n=1 Tax=Aspergillus wentii DTO 134E9 TaxID=1073089 RepID=A0A1L9R3X6_ASPWE|nr:uncharacterized protein ASPWEDRAFT_55552 [Aspergillus wentii DTO 134E9]OJJ29582.1 hypothetical protein ASPWEDRAFT_55552 [Aspergillus wentii DTO 134E9]
MSDQDYGHTTPDEQQDLESLDPDGNLILSVEGQNIRQFLVSSKILSLASPVLAKLLGPNFREGKQITESHCPTLSLHDDDPVCMKIIFEILHYQGNEEDQLNAKRLALMAVHCDKYNLIKALRPWIFKWFHDCQPITTDEDYGYLLLAAHLFRDEVQFSQLSASAQTQLSPEFFIKWQKIDILKLLPDATGGDLADRIEKLQQEIAYELQSIEGSLRDNRQGYEMQGQVCVRCGRTYPISAGKCHSCRNSQLYVKHCTTAYRIAEYFSALRKSELWPSVQPFRICSAETIALRISRAKANLGHNCAAGNICPLELELDIVFLIAGYLMFVVSPPLYFK